MLLSQVKMGIFKQNLLYHLFNRFLHENNLKTLYPLKSRALLKITGSDSMSFLQGLITNDMHHFDSGAMSLYTMFLNNKGRVLYDSLVYKWTVDNGFILDCDKNVSDLLQKHLRIYKLRSNVDIGNVTPLYKVWALLIPGTAYPEIDTDNEAILGRNIAIFKDPRLPELGYRLITPTKVDKLDLQEAVGEGTVLETDELGYKLTRFRLGVSEGGEDLFPGVSLPLEVNCDYLHGVSFHKGCYIGQELTARVHHTGVVRKRIMPFKFKEQVNDESLEKDTPIVADSELKATVGKLRNFCQDCGIGLVRIQDALEAKSLYIGQYPIEIMKPTWWPIEAPKEKAPIIKSEQETTTDTKQVDV